jgi:hypothetical protein
MRQWRSRLRKKGGSRKRVIRKEGRSQVAGKGEKAKREIEKVRY